MTISYGEQPPEPQSATAQCGWTVITVAVPAQSKAKAASKRSFFMGSHPLSIVQHDLAPDRRRLL